MKLNNSSEVEEGEECRLCGFPLCADHRVSLLKMGRCQTNIVFPGNKSEIRGGVRVLNFLKSNYFREK